MTRFYEVDMNESKKTEDQMKEVLSCFKAELLGCHTDLDSALKSYDNVALTLVRERLLYVANRTNEVMNGVVTTDTKVWVHF